MSEIFRKLRVHKKERNKERRKERKNKEKRKKERKKERKFILFLYYIQKQPPAINAIHRLIGN